MTGTAFAFFLLAASLLAVAVVVLRLRTVERELRRAKGGSGGEPPAPAPRPEETLAAPEARALFWSPLSVILVQCGLAREAGDAERRIGIIERHACRLRDLLEMQRLPGFDVVGEKRDLDATALVRAAVDVHAGLALERGVKVHVLTEATPPLRTSPALASHALRHLVRAAVESAPRGTGDVTVATGLLPLEGEPTHVAFAVADDGPGIEPARLARLMDPAASGGAPPRAFELSYAIVDAVAIALDAEFTVDSRPGQGTRATLKVPLVRAGVEVLERAPAPEPVHA